MKGTTSMKVFIIIHISNNHNSAPQIVLGGIANWLGCTPTGGIWWIRTDTTADALAEHLRQTLDMPPPGRPVGPEGYLFVTSIDRMADFGQVNIDSVRMDALRRALES